MKMKKIIPLLAIILMWSCEERCQFPSDEIPEQPEQDYNPVVVFSQKIEQSWPCGSIGPDYAIVAEWRGQDIKSVKYDCLEYSTSKDITDNDISEILTKSFSVEELERINEKSSCVYGYFEIEPEKVFEIVSVATDYDGNSIVCRDTMSLKTVIIENSFYQYLSLANSVEDAQIYTKNTVLACYDGSNIVSVKYDIFEYAESADISDEDIIDNLTQEFSDHELATTNNFSIAGGCRIYLADLKYETLYEVVAYATFEDTETMLLRGQITTGADDSKEDNPHEKISYTEYSLKGTPYNWTFDNYNTEVLIINCQVELAQYISLGQGATLDETEESYPEIGFSKHSLVLAHGQCTNGISTIEVTDFIELSKDNYILNIDISLNMTDEAPVWALALVTDKLLSEQSNIELLVTTSSN